MKLSLSQGVPESCCPKVTLVGISDASLEKMSGIYNPLKMGWKLG